MEAGSLTAKQFWDIKRNWVTTLPGKTARTCPAWHNDDDHATSSKESSKR